MKLKIMTYNVASGRCYDKRDSEGKSYSDITKCAEFIKSENPVFCGLNEVNFYSDNRENANQVEHIAKVAGFENSYFAKAIHIDMGANTRDYGNGVIANCPIISAETIAIPDAKVHDENIPYESRCIAKVKLDIAGGITVLQIHFGLAISEHQNAVDALCKVIDETDGPIILMGDFNIRPSDYLHRPLRERLFDTADIYPDKYLRTFPTYKEERNYPNCKIDYIYVSKHFKTLSVSVPDTNISDHYPMTAEVEI